LQDAAGLRCYSGVLRLALAGNGSERANLLPLSTYEKFLAKVSFPKTKQPILKSLNLWQSLTVRQSVQTVIGLFAG
jgi:hypothetical protein